MYKYILVFFIVIAASNSVKAQYPGNVSSDLRLWLRADTGTSTIDNGKAVNYWTDIAENGFSAYDSSMGSPTYESDAINFNPAVLFDGIDDGLNFGSNYIFSEGSGLSVLLVIKPDAASVDKDKQFMLDFGHFPNEGYGAVYGNYTGGIYSATSHGGSNKSNNIEHSRGSDVTLYSGYIEFGEAMQVCLNAKDYLVDSVTLAGLSSSVIQEYPQPSTNSKGPLTIGRQSMELDISKNRGRLFSGRIAEVIIYDDILSDGEKGKVQSYLAMKYGITLDQSIAQNVVASNGNTVWNASENGIYINNITTIGRDNDSDYLQGKSKSVNNDAMITLWGGNLEVYDAPDILPNFHFVSWSHNNAVLDSLNRTDVPISISERIGRTWRLSCKDVNSQEEISVSHASILVDLKLLTGEAAVSPSISELELSWLRLMVSDSPVMSAADLYAPDSIDVANRLVYFFLDGIVDDGKYLTISSTKINPLPVELMNFTGEAGEKSVKLRWQTASEIENDKFIVQRSADLKSWETISQIKGAGNSNKINYYSLEDRDPLDGESYYRLKQQDFNGTYSYSKNIRVMFSEKASTLLEVLVYPNPVVNKAHIVTSGNVGATYIELLDKRGQVRFADLIEDKQKYKLNSTDLENGVYILRANSGKSTSYQKIIVQNN